MGCSPGSSSPRPQTGLLFLGIAAEASAFPSLPFVDGNEFLSLGEALRRAAALPMAAEKEPGWPPCRASPAQRVLSTLFQSPVCLLSSAFPIPEQNRACVQPLVGIITPWLAGPESCDEPSARAARQPLPGGLVCGEMEGAAQNPSKPGHLSLLRRSAGPPSAQGFTSPRCAVPPGN